VGLETPPPESIHSDGLQALVLAQGTDTFIPAGLLPDVCVPKRCRSFLGKEIFIEFFHVQRLCSSHTDIVPDYATKWSSGKRGKTNLTGPLDALFRNLLP
jgi:hypothetical protein